MIIKLMAISIAAVVLVGCASGYYTEYNDIKSQLLKTPNIDIIQMGGNKDPEEFRHHNMQSLQDFTNGVSRFRPQHHSIHLWR